MNRKLLSEQPLRMSLEDLENMNFLNNEKYNVEESQITNNHNHNHVIKKILCYSHLTLFFYQ